ncbi:hypothetical protein AX17_001438 [Amanita inopinata Kibby_2008]|nr:hypothetical protein AX17_001438 [Amanita inopinata Kibby_2008]
MPYAAPALLIGLGARILLDTFTRTEESNIRDFLLIGAWQGTALQYAYKNTDYLLFVGLAVLIKLFLDFSSSADITRLSATTLGSAVGFICTDVISQLFEEPENPSDRRRRKTHVPTTSCAQRQRIVQFHRNVEPDNERALRLKHAVSDITSVDSDSELVPAKDTMTPLEREIAYLRARASLADSERRRYKEERKWAISQGNMARASQMKWEVKRYTALMENFNKQADAKVIEVGLMNGTLRQTSVDDANQASSSSKTRLTYTNGPARQNDGKRAESSNPPRLFTRPVSSQHPASQDRAPQHRQFSGTLKSAMRDAVR